LCIIAPAFNLRPPQKFVRQFEGKPGNDILAEIYSMLAQLMFNTQRLEQVQHGHCMFGAEFVLCLYRPLTVVLIRRSRMHARLTKYDIISPMILGVLEPKSIPHHVPRFIAKSPDLIHHSPPKVC
jgi:hypothetical protein